ncbi:MAG: hypothetical protein K9K88_05005 [Desulfobacterales bacterium]|nr:hypothetical protein [Desulfobacterales bacterium]
MNRKEIDKEVFDLLNRAKPAPSQSSPVIFLAMILIVLLTIAALGYGFYLSHFEPRGKITRPLTGAAVPRIFELRGYTENIPPERRYVWITVDVPELGLSWPKRRIYNVNEPFKTKIFEAGPNRTFTVSLYALNRDYTEEILQWFEENRLTGREAGFPTPPIELRLDRIQLVLNRTGGF